MRGVTSSSPAAPPQGHEPLDHKQQSDEHHQRDRERELITHARVRERLRRPTRCPRVHPLGTGAPRSKAVAQGAIDVVVPVKLPEEGVPLRATEHIGAGGDPHLV